MKQYTPEEEEQHVSDSSETFHFKFISQKIKAYKPFKVDDIIVDESSKVKYKITYIDSEFGLIYGRRVCLSGALSKNLHHITGMYSTFIIDADQINALLLGDAYDPSSKAKEISRQKREAYKQRVKQRKKMSRNARDVEAWCVKHLTVNSNIWITGNAQEDRIAGIHKYRIDSINYSSLSVVDTNNKCVFVYYDNFHRYNIYLTPPVVYGGKL